MAFIKQLHDSLVGHAYNDCIWLHDSLNRKLHSDSKVLRIHIPHIINRKPQLHDGTVTVDTVTRTGWWKFLLVVVNHQILD